MNTKTRVARLKWLIPLWAAAMSLALMLGIGLAYPNSSAATEATAAATGSGSQQVPALTLDPTCELAWRVVGSPAPEGSYLQSLNGVAAISANDVWAVGYAHVQTCWGGCGWEPDRYDPQTLHWDGASWSIDNSSYVGMGLNVLTAVAAVSTNDVWAVGYSQYDVDSPQQPLIMHWDGTSWSVVPNPGMYGTLTGVAAISANDVWAVGGYYDGTTLGTQTIHWDGVSWSASPSGTGLTGVLYGVAAVSANDVWTVGYYYDGTIQRTQTIHWDGAIWSVVPSPNPGMYGTLTGVAAISTNDVWAVGYYYDGTTWTALTMHWDGTSWSIVPNLGPSPSDLTAVAAISTNDVWAMGSVMMHWDGVEWSVVPGPSGNGVAAVAANDVWAVGEAYGFSQTIHYSTDCLEVTPTPTHTITPTATATFTATPTRTATPTPVPDFTLSVNPTSRSVGRPPSSTTYALSLASVGSYSGSVNLSVSGLPAKATYSFSPNPVALTPGSVRSSVLTINTHGGTPRGTYALTITGTDGVRIRSQTVTLVVDQ